jgi:hypothetical protein
VSVSVPLSQAASDNAGTIATSPTISIRFNLV